MPSPFRARLSTRAAGTSGTATAASTSSEDRRMRTVRAASSGRCGRTFMAPRVVSHYNVSFRTSQTRSPTGLSSRRAHLDTAPLPASDPRHQHRLWTVTRMRIRRRSSRHIARSPRMAVVTLASNGARDAAGAGIRPTSGTTAVRDVLEASFWPIPLRAGGWLPIFADIAVARDARKASQKPTSGAQRASLPLSEWRVIRTEQFVAPPGAADKRRPGFGESYAWYPMVVGYFACRAATHHRSLPSL